MSIDKSAQKRSLRDRMTETFDISTRTLSLFDKQFADYMQKLRTADDFARKEAAQLKPLLKQVGTLLAGSDYLGAAAKLANYYEILESILSAFDVLTRHLTDERHTLLVDHLDDNTKRNILKYFRRSKKANEESELLTKRANVLNWFAGKFNARRRALKSLEKRVPELKNLREAVKKEYANADALLLNLFKSFDAMSKARSKGDISGYHTIINDMNRIIQPAKGKFDTFYDTSVEPFVKYIEDKINANDPNRHGVKEMVNDRYRLVDEPVSEEVTPSSEPAETSSTGVGPTAPGPIAPGQAYPTTGKGLIPNVAPKPLSYTAPPPVGKFVNPHVFENKAPSSSVAPPPESGTQKAEVPQVEVRKMPSKKAPSTSTIDGKPLPLAPPGRAKQKADDGFAYDYSLANDHSQFITKLAEVDENNLSALAQEILAYSESLEPSDPVASLKLLAIAEGLIDN